MDKPSGVPRVVGRYALYDAIASGGMATVHLGRLLGPVGFSRTVAIKRMHPHIAQDPDFVSMFLDEARLVARISHPNVVPTLDVVSTDGELLIVMEYVRGESLGALLRAITRSGGFMPAPMAVALLVGVLSGLHAAHEARSETGQFLDIVHRDVSPQNILVGVDGVPRVLDFGVAKAAGRVATTREGQLKGKPAYMSPEQIAGEVTRATDIYAASVVLWEALTCRRLFAGENEAQIIVRVMQGCKVPPSEHARDVSPALDRVVMRGLSVDPAKRFATAKEMAEALEEVSLGIMSPQRIGEWVQAVGKDELEQRGQRVSALESDTTLPELTDSAALMAVRPPTTPPAAPRRRHWLLGAAALALAAVGVGFLARSPASRQKPGDSVPVRSAEPVAAPRATTVSDLPRPETRVPAAAAEYAAGIQSLRDNSWEVASRHFERAVELDPALAAAHMRLAMVSESDPSRKREEFAKASALRAQLSPRDQAMLEALEPVLQRAKVDRPEALERLERASAAYPLDVEFVDWMGSLRQHDPTGALARTERAIALDPNDGDAWQIKAESLALLERTDEARAAFERCSTLSVGSVDCVFDLVGLDAEEGRCDDYEAEARRLVDRSPQDSAYLGQAMFAKGRALAVVAETLEQGLAHEEEPDRGLDALAHKRAFAVLSGDFGLAEDLSRKALAAAKASSKRDDRDLELGLAAALLEVLDETGQAEPARKIAYDQVSRSDAWASSNTTSAAWDRSFIILRRAVGNGALTTDDFEDKRAVWVDERLKTLSAYPGRLWGYAYAAPAATPAEARSALTILPKFTPLTSHVAHGLPDADAYVGRAYLLAGKTEDALPYLKRAVANCNALFSLVAHTRAALYLGQALEASGDKPGACKAYAIVLDRWGRAKPRSLTADKARERAKALACAR